MGPLIHIGLSPNTEPDDIIHAVWLLLTPWRWRGREYVSRINRWFGAAYPNHRVWAMQSGRVALYGLLRAFGIGKGDEVLLQAFTCVAVPNCVLWVGATPVYVDTNDRYTMDIRDLRRKITAKTKAIIVQHTFGVPAQLSEIARIAETHRIILIEDCAHVLGEQGDNRLGNTGDAAFFSFGRDKMISSVFGGAAIIQRKKSDAVAGFDKFEKSLPEAPPWWVAQQLFHPVASAVVLPLYRAVIGKIILLLLQKLHLLSFPVYRQEKQGHMPSVFPRKYPEALAALAFFQLSKLAKLNRRRRTISALYEQHFGSFGLKAGKNIQLPLLRYPVRTKKKRIILQKAKQSGMVLGNWYTCPVDPPDTVLSRIGYVMGSCPNAERLARECVNLPTLVTFRQANDVIDFFRSDMIVGQRH